jgi:hypothetical protein
MTEELKDGIKHMSSENEMIEDEIPIEEIFTEDFMLSCSEYLSIDQFLEDSGIAIMEGVVYEEIQSPELDTFVNDKTDFENWQEMFDAAVANYENLRDLM